MMIQRVSHHAYERFQMRIVPHLSEEEARELLDRHLHEVKRLRTSSKEGAAIWLIASLSCGLVVRGGLVLTVIREEQISAAHHAKVERKSRLQYKQLNPAPRRKDQT
jgi:hypothetical protein